MPRQLLWLRRDECFLKSNLKVSRKNNSKNCLGSQWKLCSEMEKPLGTICIITANKEFTDGCGLMQMKPVSFA